MNDGDKALVIQDETFVKVAERNMNGIVPLYYKMAKAGAEEINSKDIYKSLVLAYKANIGEVSNNITKIWSSNNVNLDVIKWLTMENNFVIDYAKTLYMPTRPEHVDKVISQYIKAKVPHFFIYAKDKDKNRVEEINDCTVNRLEGIIPKKPIRFQKIAGKLKYKLLMKNKKVEVNDEIITLFEKLDKNKKWIINSKNKMQTHETLYVYKIIRDELLKINNDIEYVVDVLVKYLYQKNSSRKETLWKSFGDILLENLKRNIAGTKQCECCGERIEVKSNRTKYCNKCWEKIQRELWRKNKQKHRNVQV